MRRADSKKKKKNPAHSGELHWKPLSFLTPAVFFIIPTIPLFSSSPLPAFCPHTLIWPCLPIYIFYIFSHLILHAHSHACTHTLTHRLQKSEPVVPLEWESADERRPICDWMTEWLKEWRAKAVKLSVSLHRSRRQEPTLRCKSSSQAQCYRVRSTRIGIFTQMHS